MNPLPHEGASPVGMSWPATVPAPPLPLAFLRFLVRWPATAGDAALALGASLSHDFVHQQVVGAHRVGDLARKQADALAEAGRALPSAPLREAAHRAGQVQAGLIDAWLETANAYGRAFARKAFAFPVAPTFRD